MRASKIIYYRSLNALAGICLFVPAGQRTPYEHYPPTRWQYKVHTVHTHTLAQPRRATLHIIHHIIQQQQDVGWEECGVCSRASRGRRLRPNNFISMQHIFAISISYFHIFDEILLFIRFLFVLLSLSLSLSHSLPLSFSLSPSVLHIWYGAAVGLLGLPIRFNS